MKIVRYGSANWQVGVLLEHTVGNLDPLYIVNMVPNGLEIPRLVQLKYNFMLHLYAFVEVSIVA